MCTDDFQCEDHQGCARRARARDLRRIETEHLRLLALSGQQASLHSLFRRHYGEQDAAATTESGTIDTASSGGRLPATRRTARPSILSQVTTGRIQRQARRDTRAEAQRRAQGEAWLNALAAAQELGETLGRNVTLDDTLNWMRYVGGGISFEHASARISRDVATRAASQQTPSTQGRHLQNPSAAYVHPEVRRRIHESIDRALGADEDDYPVLLAQRLRGNSDSRIATMESMPSEPASRSNSSTTMSPPSAPASASNPPRLRPSTRSTPTLPSMNARRTRSDNPHPSEIFTRAWVNDQREQRRQQGRNRETFEVSATPDNVRELYGMDWDLYCELRDARRPPKEGENKWGFREK